MEVIDPQLPPRLPAEGTRELSHTLRAYAYGAFTLYGAAFQRTSASPLGCYGKSRNTTSTLPYGKVFGLRSAAFGRPYSRHPVWFLFLRVLRCFNSPGSPSPPLRGECREGQEFPFGHPRIKGCVRLPGAYRSLPRPSSAPWTQPSTTWATGPGAPPASLGRPSLP